MAARDPWSAAGVHELATGRDKQELERIMLGERRNALMFARWEHTPPSVLLALSDRRITQDGVLVLKAQRSRSLEQNKEDALRRLQELVDSVAELPAPRRPTRPTRSSQRKRMDAKTTRGQTKALRGKVSE